MSQDRHSYVAFYPSDWLGGTARMTRLHKSVYFDICLYIWDKASACPASELPLMLGDLPNWRDLIEDLIAAGKLDRRPDGSLVNDRALASAEKAFALWQAQSQGGKTGAKKTNKTKVKPESPAEPPVDTPAKSPAKSPVGLPGGEPSQNQNQNQTLSEDKSSDAGASPAAPGKSPEPSKPAGLFSVAEAESESAKGDSEVPIPPFLVRVDGADISKILFNQGLAWVAQQIGKEPAKCRALLGQWRKASANDDRQIWSLLVEASKTGVADLPSWMTACLKPRAAGAPPDDDGLSPAVRAIIENSEAARAKGAA